MEVERVVMLVVVAAVMGEGRVMERMVVAMVAGVPKEENTAVAKKVVMVAMRAVQVKMEVVVMAAETVAAEEAK